MKNSNLVDIIREKFTEQKMSAEYMLKLNKVVEKEDAFTKTFNKENWQEYFDLDLEKMELHSIELDEIINFTIQFLKSLNLQK